MTHAGLYVEGATSSDHHIEPSGGIRFPLDGADHMSPQATREAVAFMGTYPLEEIRLFRKNGTSELRGAAAALPP